MRAISATVTLALLAVAAFGANDAPPVNTITVRSGAVPPPPISTPASIGRPHECLGFYPPDDVLADRQGKTIVGFTITKDGTVADPKIATPSGVADLDEAALACVRTWRYKPAVENGAPIAVPWKAQVIWYVPPADTPMEGALRYVRADAWHCVRASQAMAALPPGFVNWLEVYVTFGKPTNILTTRSSGIDALDRQASECVRTSRHFSDLEKARGDLPAASLRIAVWNLPAP